MAGYTIQIKACSSFIHCKDWKLESESMKLMYLDEDAFPVSSMDLMIVQVQPVNMGLFQPATLCTSQLTFHCESFLIPATQCLTHLV